MAEAGRSTTPAIIGFLIAGAAILGASFLASTLDRNRNDDGVPAITVIAPAAGDSVSEPLRIEFRTPARLSLHPGMGWMASDLHLHAMVNDQEYMPAAADITASDSTWSWQLPILGSGTHRIYLTWAGRHHGNLRGQTDTINVHIR